MSETNELDVAGSEQEGTVATDAAPVEQPVGADAAPAGGSDDAEGSETEGEAPAGGSSSRRRSGSVRELEEEGEVAADYLEELLDIIDVDGDIDIDVENGRASLAILGESGGDRNLRRLVGQDGEVLEALQELTRLAVQASTGERSRLMLDVADHRAKRRQQISEQAKIACEKVVSSGEKLNLEPMSAFERKIVHDVVADSGLVSESEGVDPKRYVVILPAGS